MLATQIEVSDGTLHTINVGIEFFEQDDISVSLDQAVNPLVVGVDYQWTTSTTIQFLNTTNTPGGLVPNGVEVLLRRDTKNDEMYNIYDGGAPFSRLSLDENFEQLLRLSQEFSEGLGLDGLRNTLNMNGYGIINLKDPVSPKDAANKAYIDDIIAELVSSGSGPIAAAVNVSYVPPTGPTTNLQALSGALGYTLIGGLSAQLPRFPEFYGAVGDGIADDTIPLQAALNAGGIVQGKSGSKYRVVTGVQTSVPGTSLRWLEIVYSKTPATFYHAVRLVAPGCTADNVHVKTDASVTLRDDTGFGFLISGDSQTVTSCSAYGIGSAGFWATNATNSIIANCRALYCLADGFHVSDGCRTVIVHACETVGCHDDSFAVVGDTPAAAPPTRVLISSCITDGSVAGHGCVTIACEGVIVANGDFSACGAAGLSSYFWNLSGAPVDKDWANHVLYIGCVISAPAQAPVNANNVCGIFIGSLRNSAIKMCTINGPKDSVLAPSACIRAVAWQNVSISGNTLQNSSSYGLFVPDDNANGPTTTAGMFLADNNYQNIVKEAVRAIPTAGMGVFGLWNSTFYQCAYDAGTANLFTIGRCTTNLVTVFGNINVDNDKIGVVDFATCSNYRIADNAPAIFIPYSPAASAVTNTWTAATSTGTYHVKGRTVFFNVSITVTTKGTGTNMKFNLPKTSRGSFNCTGRENVVGGKMCVGIQSSSTQVTVFDYNNADPAPSNGSQVGVSGYFEAVSI